MASQYQLKHSFTFLHEIDNMDYLHNLILESCVRNQNNQSILKEYSTILKISVCFIISDYQIHQLIIYCTLENSIFI